MNPYKKFRKQIFKELTFRLEIFTHIVPVPAVVYYAALAMLTFSKKFTDFAIITLIIASIISAVLMLLWGVIFRYYKIKKVFIIQDNQILKLELLRLPKFESIIIGMRWTIGVIGAYLMIIPFLGVPIFLAIIPIEMTSHYLITENIIRKYIKKVL